MLPSTYQIPAAAVLLAGGVLACFFGYRMFKAVLAVFGFIVGALAASSVFGATDTTPMVLAAIVGGVAGAALLLAAYFVGVALVDTDSIRPVGELGLQTLELNAASGVTLNEDVVVERGLSLECELRRAVE